MYAIYIKFKYHIVIFAVVILSCFMAISQFIYVKADSTYGYPNITFPHTYHITGNLYRSYKANGALMTTSAFPLSKDGEYAYQIYYSVKALTGPVTIYLADTSGNNVLTLYSSGGAGGAEIAKSDTVAIPASLIDKTVTFNVKEYYAASFWTDYNHDIYVPTVYYKTKPIGAGIQSSGKIQMNFDSSGSLGDSKGYTCTTNITPWSGGATGGKGHYAIVHTVSDTTYDLSQATTIKYSGITNYLPTYGNYLNSQSVSAVLKLIDAVSQEEICSFTVLQNTEGEIDLSSVAQTKDLSNVEIQMTNTASLWRTQSFKGSTYMSATLPQYIEIENDSPVISIDIPTVKTYNYGGPLSFTVEADGKEPLFYQWYENDVAIEGATSDTLDLGKQEGLRYNNSKFYCKITNEFGTTTSETCVLKANVGTFKPFIYTVHLGDTDKTSQCEVVADINYAYYVAFPATLTLEPADLDKDLPIWKKIFSRIVTASFSDSELKEELTEMYSEPDFYTSNFSIKAKTTTEGLGNKYISVYTEPTEESKEDLDEDTVETLTDAGPDFSIKGAAILRDVEDSNNLAGVFITQDTIYFGNSSNKFVAPISSSKWSIISGLAGAYIDEQGCYKGNFNFVYGLVDADTAEIPD